MAMENFLATACVAAPGKQPHPAQFDLILRAAVRRQRILFSLKKAVALKPLFTEFTSMGTVVLAVATVVSCSQVSDCGPETNCVQPPCVVCCSTQHGLALCVTFSDLKACFRRKTELVFKINIYQTVKTVWIPTILLRSVCVHVPVSGRCSLKCLSCVCVL